MERKLNAAELYAKARGSKSFLLGLVVFVVGWLTLTCITGFDADHGLINLILSAEASVSLAFFAMMGEEQDRRHQQQMEAMLDLIRAVKEEEDRILAEVEK